MNAETFSHDSNLLNRLAQAVQTVEGRGFVTFRQGRIVEDRIDKIVDGCIQRHYSLANVDQLAGAFADDVHAKQVARFAMEDELQSPRGVAANLTARDFAIVCDSHLVR